VQRLREQLLRIPVATLLVIPAVLAPRVGGAIRRALAWRPIVFIGVVSYGLYLWHTFVGGELYDFKWIPRDLRVVVAYTATVAVATASWYLLERPIMNLARRRPSRSGRTT
jgi:peptidoglycan/LPS O-acetylase OafA/YrhL